jgi:outer membrane protein assembly factor BamA
MALPFTLESILRQKRIMETQIFHHAKIESSKNPLKETKILQDITTL